MRSRDAGQRQGRRRYPSLVAFYNADPRRIASREQDVGLCWREDQDGPIHRAAWIQDTGELYLVCSGPPAEGGGGVEVLASVGNRERLDEVLGGWRERCGELRSLPWLRSRTERLGRARGPMRRRAGEVRSLSA
jgi:hypothetical protein